MASVIVQTPDHVHVSNHGAHGDGVHDDYAAIQGAITAALASKQPLRFDARTYAVSQPIVIDHFLSVFGQPRSGDAWTSIKALEPMRAVLELRGGVTHRVHDVELDADHKAKHALFLQGCSFGDFDRVTVTRATHDGVFLAKYTDTGGYSIDDNNRWTRLTAAANGTLFLTPDLRPEYVIGEGTPRVSFPQAVSLPGASCSCEDGSRVVTFEGVDILELDLRPGDPIRIVNGSTRKHFGDHFLVQKVISDSALAVNVAPDVTASGCSFAIGRGDGYHEEEGDGDNNLATFHDGLWRANAGCGVQIHGSYGCRFYGGNIEYGPFWGAKIGCYAEEYVSTSISPVFVGTYFEALSRRPFALISAVGLRLDGLVAVEGDDAYDAVGGAQTPYVRGIRLSDSGIEPIGFLRNSMPSTWLYDGKLQGHTTIESAVVQPINATGTNDTPSNHWVIRTGLDPITLTGTPTLALRTGKFLFLENEGPASVTLQDDLELPGSGLRLVGPTLTLEPGHVILLMCNGTRWTQVRT